MKKTGLVTIVIVLFLAVPVFAKTKTVYTPYACPHCNQTFHIEGALVAHMVQHNEYIQSNGLLPEYTPVKYEFRDFEPVPFYQCPDSGRCFYSEPAFCCWRESL